MKKFLLSLIACVSLGFIGHAEDVTLTMADLFGSSTISGITEKTSGDITMTFSKASGSTAPAYNKAGDVRLYAKNTFTIKSTGAEITNISFAISTQGLTQFSEIEPSTGEIETQGSNPLVWKGSASEITFTIGSSNEYGTNKSKSAGQFDFTAFTYTIDNGGASLEPANLKFSESEVTLTIGDAFTAPTLTKDTDAAVTYTSSTPEVATVNATTGAVEILAVGTTTITATAEKNDKYTGGTASYTITVNRVVETATFNKVTTITSDKKYVMVADGKVATQVPEKGYGYINVEDATGDASVTVDVLNAITIAAVDGGYTLQDASGRYIYQTGDYNSFNAAATLPAEGGIWTIAFEADGSAKITNVSTGKYIQYSANYTSYGCYADEQGSLPALYELAGSSAITDITVDENAPVEYFNLQGIRVDNPENGLYIRRQGNNVSKVLVK